MGYSALILLTDRQNPFHSIVAKGVRPALNHKTAKTPLAPLVIDLAESQEKLRKIQREIGRMNSKTQIGYLMKIREELMKTVEAKKTLLSKKVDLEPLDLEIFRTIYRALSVYGRSVIESVILTFERESGNQPLEISANPESFHKCLQKVFGRSSSKRIESTIIFEISNEFGLLVSNKTTLSDAINIVKSNISKLQSGQDFLQEKEKA